MNILFLDIDGVLVTGNLWDRVPEDQCVEMINESMVHVFDNETVEHLNVLADMFDIKYVISSTWRFKGIDKLRTIFSHRSIRGEIIDVTKAVYGSRGRQVQEWIDANAKDGDRWAIIDDDDDMLPSQESNFFQTEFQTGLDENVFKSLVEFFSNTSS